PDEGSVFTIKLPTVVSDAAPEPGDEAAPAAGDAARVAPATTAQDGADADAADAFAGVGCVLVIDDDPVQRDLMQRFLGKEGFVVRAAASGREGLRLARQIHPVAITLDVMMPEMDGWSVLRALKADTALRDIPVVMLTMVDDPERGFALGAADYATKPVNRQRLSRILRKHTCPHPPCPVLLVDDDAAARALTRKVLEKEGWKVCEAENGLKALECLERERPHLILLDLMMPVMDGFEFAEQVRQHDEWRSIPIVVLSSRDLSAADRLRLNGHVESVLKKEGGSREGLLLQVRDLLDEWVAPRDMTLVRGGERRSAVGRRVPEAK
ncbi:MAG TPA: response regulator, partial [Longimicrobium sp.]|nr:response regulator [Longimicrobium sp.]